MLLPKLSTFCMILLATCFMELITDRVDKTKFLPHRGIRTEPLSQYMVCFWQVFYLGALATLQFSFTFPTFSILVHVLYVLACH